jgi:hypothetical protein
VTNRTGLTTATLVGALAWPAVLAAQDAHYWTYGYGPVGQLTEGVLIGGVNDLSAVYYNPGALALIEKPRFVIGLTSVELANIHIPGAAGAGLDIGQHVFDLVPAMVSGQVGGHDGPNRFAFAVLARHDSDWDLAYSNEQLSPENPDGGAGIGRTRQRLVEYWVGGTWSRRLSDRLSVGVSPFFAYRAQRSRRSLTLEEVAASASRALFVDSEYEYDNVRLLAKMGLAWRPGDWELGLTATTPGLRLFGQGKAVFNAAATGDVPDPFIAATTQEGLHATYHAPWAVGAGVTWRRVNTAIHTTAEWFSSVSAYDILQPEPAPVAGSSTTIPLEYRGEAKSVVCYGVGLEQHLGSRLALYGGAAHNGSAYVPLRDSFAAWNLTDVSGGFTLATGRATLALGIGYAWGKSPLPQIVVPPEEASPPTREASFSRWTFSFGASFAGR